MGYPSSSDGKESAYNAGDLGLIPELERSSGEGNGDPLQYSSLKNPHGQRSLAGYRPWGCKESDMTEQLSTQRTHSYHYVERSIYCSPNFPECCVLAQLCLTLCDPTDCSPPGSSVHGDSSGRILEWVAILFLRESSPPVSPALEVEPQVTEAY